MPEDVAYISSESGVDMLREGKVMSVARTDRQTDGFSSLYSSLCGRIKAFDCFITTILFEAGS